MDLHDRLAHGVGYLASPSKHFSGVLRISADALLADTDLDTRDAVGECTRHGDGAIDIRPANILELAD